MVRTLYKTSVDRNSLLLQMLRSLSKLTQNCEHVIYSNFRNGKNESKVKAALVQHLMKRPDFSGVIKIAKHYDGKSDKTKRKHAEFLKEAKEESLTANNTPYDVFKENLEIDKANRKKKLS